MITGMSCAACQIRIEKSVRNVRGVESCFVNLLTNSMIVEGTASTQDVIRAVISAGYGAERKNATVISENKQIDFVNRREISKIKKRLIISVILLIPLLYVSMGYSMMNWPIPDFMVDNYSIIGFYEMVLAGLIMAVNRKFFVSGFKGLINKSPNMDTLIAIGATASYGYSIYELVEILFYESNYFEGFYFESSAMILTFISVGKLLEGISKGKTTDAINSLINLAPRTAVLMNNGEEITVPIEEVKVGDRFVVRPGESIPADGIIIEGRAAINESMLTGESIPQDKTEGDSVSAATINVSGFIVCEAVKIGEDTVLAEIIRCVCDAAASKAPISKIADRVSAVFVPAVIVIAFLTLCLRLILGQSAADAITGAVSVLVISCPCALGLATPVAIMVGNGVAAKIGILFKSAVSLEQTGKAQIVVLDKTGTITTGIMHVTDIWTSNEKGTSELLKDAYALEVKSNHPVSGAIAQYASENNTELCEVSDFEYIPGRGIAACLDGVRIAGGNYEFISNLGVSVNKEFKEKMSSFENEGKTAIIFAQNKIAIGIIAVADVIKNDSAKAVFELKKMGMRVVMLTGDNEAAAKNVAEAVGIDDVISHVVPNVKEGIICELKKYGRVIMVGDGINDAPALTAADIGIAIGAGSDIAIDAADVVLMKNSIRDVVAAVRISKSVLRNIYENLFWAFFYNVICIPLAAGIFIKPFGWRLNPMIGALAMGLSGFFVVSNALRLKTVKPYNAQRDKKIKKVVNGCIINSTISDIINKSYGKDNIIMRIGPLSRFRTN